MSSIMKGLQGPMSEEMDDDEFDAMVARLKQKAAKQEKLKAQGKEPQTKQDPKTGKYYVDFDDEQVKETSSTGQGGGSAGIGGGAGLGIEASPIVKALQNESDDAFDPEGATVKNSLHTIIRVATHLERTIKDQDQFPEWVSEKIGSVKDQMVSVMDYKISSDEIKGINVDEHINSPGGMGQSYRKFKPTSAGVAEGSIHQGDLYNAVIEYFRSDRGYRNAMIMRKKAENGMSAEELATLLNNFSDKKWGTKLTPSDAVDAVKNIVYPHRFEQGVEEGKLGTALGAIGLGAMMAMNPAHADVKTSDANVSKDSQTTTHTQPSPINYRQDKVYKAIQNALDDMHPKWDYNMLSQFSYHFYNNYKETGKLDSEIVNYYKVMQSDTPPPPGFSKKYDAAVAAARAAGQVKETSEGWQDDERRRFKRQELQHELGREQSNNIQVKIDGRPWKVFAGRGSPDSAEEYRHLRSMKAWAEKKSAATGKKWEVYLTGAPADVKENQQGLGEEQAPMFTPEDKMVNANNPTGTGWRFYKAAPAGAKESAIMKGLGDK